MSARITKITMKNFKRFRNYAINPNERINILVGDNEAGKSTVIEAIDIVTSGNIKRVESIGIDKLMNIEAVNSFNAGIRNFENLPEIIVELFFDGIDNHYYNGNNNSERKVCDGIRMLCIPDEDYRNEINKSLISNKDYFPYDYYLIKFSTFADQPYTNYKKKIHSILIDSSNMNHNYATNDFVHRMYNQYTENDIKERAYHKNEYRIMRTNFQKETLNDLNNRISTDNSYKFGLKNGSFVDLESELMIFENDVSLDSKGTGRQVFIKTDFALERSGENCDVILIEEPENHLSHVNLRKLIQKVDNTINGQLFITTHNSLISTRLELNNVLIMHVEEEDKPIGLKDLDDETAKYFLKAPPASMVEFALSYKSILVEGPSEYMLFEKFYFLVTGHFPEDDNVHIIDVRGLSFKRYLNIAKLTKCKVAVLTDNDKDFMKNCIEKYAEYESENNMKIFFDKDNKKRTFEVILYNDNKDLCVRLFGVDAESYMLNNKTETAFKLLSVESDLNVPSYIREAIEWIKD